MELVKEKLIQTEIGILPSDWKTEKMGNLTTLMTNGFVGVAKIHYTDYENGILYIQGYNVKENSFNFNGIKRVTEEFHKKNSKSYLLEGDLLTVQTGDVGLTTIVSKELEGSNCHALIISRFKRKKVNSKFISFYLNSNIGRIRLKEIETGTTMKHINVGDLIHFYVPLPPIEEQTAIATALSDTDNWINSLEQLIAKKRFIKQGAMQELLKPKEGWEAKKLGEIAQFYKGRGLPKSHLEQNGKFKCIHYGELFTKYKEVINEIISRTNEVENTFLSVTNDVLMPTSDVTPNGLATASCIKESGVILGGDVLVIRISENILNGTFLSYYVTQNREIVMKLVSGSTVYHLYGSDMKDFIVKYPKTKEEQTRISTILSEMDKEITTLEAKLEKAKQVKLGMMQELLTGRIRLV